MENLPAYLVNSACDHSIPRRVYRKIRPTTLGPEPGRGTEHVDRGYLSRPLPMWRLPCQICWSSLPYCSAHPSPLLLRPAQIPALALTVQSGLKRLPRLET